MLTGSTWSLVDSRPSAASSAASRSLKQQARSKETGEGQPGPVGLQFFSVLLPQLQPTCVLGKPYVAISHPEGSGLHGGVSVSHGMGVHVCAWVCQLVGGEGEAEQ